MADIQVLDNNTIDKIAAGEVVERPASVVKELVENAIDAGAHAVTVEIKNGGIEFIRVTDDGCGIEKSQVKKAFLRHATSKIKSIEDLAVVSSLGFRGEALSSIAAVAKVELITKVKEDLTGIRYILEGAVETDFDEIGAPEGTTFLIRNLFFNTPVRRKFLKSPMTEGSYITDLMEHMALSKPMISFKYILNGQTKFYTNGDGDLKAIIYRIYGKEISQEMIPFTMKQDDIMLTGFLGKPSINRSNRNYENYYVNNRYIKSSILSKSIEEGYKPYLMQHKYPFCVLHLSIPSTYVDVNVHPTKMDVRFSNQASLYSMIADAILNALSGKELIPDVDCFTDKERNAIAKETTAKQEKVFAPEPFEKQRTGSQVLREQPGNYQVNNHENQIFHHKSIVKEEKNKQILGDNFLEEYNDDRTNAKISLSEKQENGQDVFFEDHRYDKESSSIRIDNLDEPDNNHNEVILRDELTEESEVFFTEETENHEKDNTLAQMKETAQNAILTKIFSMQEKGEDTSPSSQTLPAKEMIPALEPVVKDVEQINLFEDKILTKEARKNYQILGQLFETYWLVSYQDKLLIIDQHAAHEKVKYEQIMKKLELHTLYAQTLNPPVIIHVSPKEEDIVKQYQKYFEELGFEIEPFGGNAYALRTVPYELFGYEEKDLFEEILSEMAEAPIRGVPDIVKQKIASMACKAAIKGNMKVSLTEANALIDQLLELDNPYHCPHGRPTIISMSKYEIEKKFKRIV